VVRDGVEVAAQVGIDHGAVSSIDQAVHGTNRIVRAAPSSVGVLFLGQIRLEDGFEHDDGSHLRDPFLDRRYAQRSLFPVGFGDVNAPHRLRPIGLAFEFFGQSIQPRSPPR
jgi:hypothetical protein